MWRVLSNPRRNGKQLTSLLAKYNEGLRLMRGGDGADEWIGMDIARRAREGLREMGLDIDGTRPDLRRIDKDGNFYA